jgi:hypothetical protein
VPRATSPRSRKASTPLRKSCVNVALAYFGLAAGGATVIWAWHAGAHLAASTSVEGLVSGAVGLALAHLTVTAGVVGGLVLLGWLTGASVWVPSRGETHDAKLAKSMDRGYGGSFLILGVVGLVFLGLATGAIHAPAVGPLQGLIDKDVFSGAPTQVEAPAPEALPQSASFNSIVGR